MATEYKNYGIAYVGFHSYMVMLHDSLWKEVSNGDLKLYLCDRCIERRLRRRISGEDLIPNDPVNNLYIQICLDL